MATVEIKKFIDLSVFLKIGLIWCPREESNLDYKIRNLASYPLNDGGIFILEPY